MAIIELSDVLFYKGGQSGVSRVVGNDWENGAVISRIARYTFTAPNLGAQAVNVTFHTTGKSDGSHNPLRFFIGTDPDSHAKADGNSEYTGELTLDTDGYVVFTGSADILLLPNVTYYLWVFPATTTYGHYSWQRLNYVSTLETIGAAGLIYIDNGAELEAYQFYIDNGSDWDLHIPHMDNGSGWDMCS